MVLLNRRRLAVVPVLIYWPTIFVLTHIPIPELVRRASVSDKTLHFVAYIILAFLLWFAVSPGKKANWRKAAVWLIVLVSALYSLVDEWYQGVVGRNADVMDFAANFAGALTGLILLSIFSFWPALLALIGITIFLLMNLTRVDLSELVPVMNAIFCFSSYAVFCLVWICNMYYFRRLKATQIKWFVSAAAMPAGLLTVVEIFSVIMGKEFRINRVVISAGGIVFAVFLVWAIEFLRNLSRKSSGDIT